MNKFTEPLKENLFALESAMNQAANAVNDYDGVVAIVHHNDTDGISAATILSESFKRIKRGVKLYCMEQIYPAPLKKIYSSHNGPIIITDLGLGSKQEEAIRKINKGKPTVIIDHHDTTSEDAMLPLGTDNIYDLNCTKYQINGDTQASASTLAYFFAGNLADIEDLAHIAVLGAFSDKNHTRGEEKGRFPSNGLDQQVERISKNIQVDEVYQIKFSGDNSYHLMDEIVQATMLLGSIGFRRKFKFEKEERLLTGPHIGVQCLTKGYSGQIKNIVNQLKKSKEEAYTGLIDSLNQGNYQELDNIVFFDTLDFFKGMGVKTVGSFCDYACSPSQSQKFPFIQPIKYIFGAQLIEPMPLDESVINPFDVSDVLKISIRTPQNLEQLINSKQSLAVSSLLKLVNPAQIGSSHLLRGSSIVTREKLAEFLEKCSLSIHNKQKNYIILPELDFFIKS